ncbi:MAG: DNA (cytosine-5-)-methyltransferase, partial [Fimbriimonadaceae bacterium]
MRVGELFCGPGGLAQGAFSVRGENEWLYQGFRHEWATDYDLDACKTYALNHAGGDMSSVICGDVRKLDIDALPEVDCLAFGFPCNDYSVVGEQKGVHGEFGPLYTYGVEYLEKKKPLCFVAENVSGLQSANGGLAFQKILQALRQAGYLLNVHMYSAELYGVPQKRRRILVVGTRLDSGIFFRVPAPTTPTPLTVRDALINEPIPEGTPNHEFTKQAPSVIERLKHIKPGQNAFNADLPDHLKLQVKGATISQIYKRLHPDEPSYTVTGSGGGGTHMYHWDENRALTNRERARLQGFPDSYQFVG